MRNAIAISLVAATAAAGAALPTGATAAGSLDACLAEHPGAIKYNEVDSGDNLVCVDNFVQVSPGNDTYLWTNDEPGAKLTYETGTAFDAGTDTLSLETWSRPWVDEYNENGSGGMFGPFVQVDVEGVRYTAFNDVIGDPNLDPAMLNGQGLNFWLGAGDDRVHNVLGQIFTGTGADDVYGVTLGTTVQTGDGADLVVGDANADLMALGAGADVAKVKQGGVDTVRAGDGADKVYASANDKIFSAVRV